VLSSVTIRGWPRRIGPADPFPHPFRRGYQELHLGPDEQPCLLYSPRLRFGRHETTAKLLVWAGQRLACLDARHGGVVTTVMSLDQVHEVEWGQALLEAWMRLEAHGPAGRAVIRVDFNAVGLPFYKPIADTARSMAYAGAHLTLGDERRKLAPLLQLDHRFVGFGAQALLSGMELRRHWFQPRVPGVLRHGLAGVRIPALLLLATQAELILVQEQAVRGRERFGTTWRCLPLEFIREAALIRDPARGALGLRIRLPEASEVRAEVSPAGEAPLRAFLGELDPRWGGAPASPLPAQPAPEAPLEATPP
jgi:hypothetical protein